MENALFSFKFSIQFLFVLHTRLLPSLLHVFPKKTQNDFLLSLFSPESAYEFFFFFFFGQVKCQKRLAGRHSGEPISFFRDRAGDIAPDFGVEGGGVKENVP